MNENGPENRISLSNAAGYRGNICPCCISLDRKGRQLHICRMPRKWKNSLRKHRKEK